MGVGTGNAERNHRVKTYRWNITMISTLTAIEQLHIIQVVSPDPISSQGLRQVAARIISRTFLCFLIIILFPFLMLEMVLVCEHRGQEIIKGYAFCHVLV